MDTHLCSSQSKSSNDNFQKRSKNMLEKTNAFGGYLLFSILYTLCRELIMIMITILMLIGLYFWILTLAMKA